MLLLIFYVSLALSVSFLCSILEAVLLSVSPSFIARVEHDHPSMGARLRRLKDEIDQPLAAILSLNTIAHTVGATGAGAQATLIFGNVYVGVISAVLTLLILVISEIIPKTLGALYWRQLTPYIIKILVPIIWIMWPLVKLTEILTRLLARNKKKALIRRDEFIALSKIGIQEGAISETESRIMNNLFHFNQLTIADIMTPRTVIFALVQDTTVSDVLKENPVIRFSRIPVYEKNVDDIVGFVLKSDILQQVALDKSDTSLKDLLRTVPMLSRELSLQKLLDMLRKHKSHIAVVVDQYGGTAGVVTMEDYLETLLGLEIVDESDNIEDMQKLARQKWAERARDLGISTEL